MPINATNSEETPILPSSVNNDQPVAVESKSYHGDTNIFLSIFNLSNAAIGMGMFSFSFAYHQTGLLSGILVTLGLVAIAGITLLILVSYGEGCSSYQQMIEKNLGKNFGFLCECILVFYLTGDCVGFLNVIFL